MTKLRTVKNVSFADTEYERGLLDYATKPEHGPFSVYVKRLIEQDRAGITIVQTKVPGVVSQAKAPTTQKDRDNAVSFL